MNRRSFFQTALTTVGALTVFSTFAKAEERRRGGSAAATAGGAPKLVDPKDPAAKAVNFVNNKAEIKDKNLQTDRTGIKFSEQHCKNCAFYTKDKETSVEGKKAAPCQMPFATGKYVSAEGWCTTWAKKA